MKVSVVVPAYNEENSIAQSIEALLVQDYPDFEIIVVNNASTDKTAEVVAKYPVKLVHESRKGLLWAREAGRNAATGDVIANIDADCLPDKNWLRQGLQHLADTDRHISYPNIVAATGPYDYHDADKLFRQSSLAMQRYIYRPFAWLLQLKPIQKGAVLIGGNNFIRADILNKTGGYNTDLTFYGEDTDTAKRVSRHGYVVFDPDLAMKTSARRFKEEGIIALEMKYLFHFFKTIFS